MKTHAHRWRLPSFSDDAGNFLGVCRCRATRIFNPSAAIHARTDKPISAVKSAHQTLCNGCGGIGHRRNACKLVVL